MAYYIIIKCIRKITRCHLSSTSVMCGFVTLACVIIIWAYTVDWTQQRTLRFDATTHGLVNQETTALHDVDEGDKPQQKDRIPDADQEVEGKYSSNDVRNYLSLRSKDSSLSQTGTKKLEVISTKYQSKDDGFVSNNSSALKENRAHHFTVKKSPLFVPPPNERSFRRFPQSVIIGFGKCGTRALLTFLNIHPYITAQTQEVHFYDDDVNFKKGYSWYLGRMPFSYSNQVTMEKTPSYIITPRARDEMLKLNPKVKLIVLMRDPVDRLVSQFLQIHRFESTIAAPLTSVYMRDGKFDPEKSFVQHGIYHQYITQWLQKFPREQFLFINDDEMTRDPLPVLKQVEAFLNIPSLYTRDNFHRNETSGFYCLKEFEASKVHCLTKMKGFKHPKLPPKDEIMLYNFYKPHNEKLYKITGVRYNWEKKDEVITNSEN